MERKLPRYSFGEELCNSITHGLGALFGVFALVACLIAAVNTGDKVAIVCGAVYGATVILLYTISTVYHALKPNAAKKVMRVIDHCSIFLMIAGTYTPYTLITLRQESPGWGFAIFGIVWAAAIVGIVLNAVSLERFKVFSIICYLAMGWAIIIAMNPLIQVFNGPGLSLLVWGGISYTLGAAFYGAGAKVRYIHSVFHIFVLIGSVLHFLSVFLYVIPGVS